MYTLKILPFSSSTGITRKCTEEERINRDFIFYLWLYFGVSRVPLLKRAFYGAKTVIVSKSGIQNWWTLSKIPLEKRKRKIPSTIWNCWLEREREAKEKFLIEITVIKFKKSIAIILSYLPSAFIVHFTVAIITIWLSKLFFLLNR